MAGRAGAIDLLTMTGIGRERRDADNLFIMGASTFPQQPAYNPTGPVGALAYWSAEAITTKYLKSPGPLVQA